MKIDERREVVLTVERSAEDWWHVHVPDVAGDEFAMTCSRVLEDALRGAVPYIACVIDDPSEAMVRLARAAEGKGS